MKKLFILGALIFTLTGMNTNDAIKLESTPVVISNVGQKVTANKADEEKIIEVALEKQEPMVIQNETIAVVEEIKEEPKNPLLIGMQGNAGRIILPAVGYEMPLYNGAESSWAGIVDANNSALYTNYMGKMMVADHAYQGFNAMKNSPIGSIGYIVQNDQIIVIRCVSIYDAINTGNGIIVGDRYADEMNDGSIFMYTCNDSTGVSVTVSFWVYA